MKVLMMPTWYSNHDDEVFSAGIFHYEQSISLMEHVDVALFFPYDNYYTKGFYKKVEKGLLTYRSGKRSRYSSRLFRIMDFIKVIRDFKPDIVHAHVAGGAGKLAIRVGVLLNIPVIVTEHNPVEMMHLDNHRIFNTIKRVYKKSSYNICVSKGLKNKLAEVFPDYTFNVLHNGVFDPYISGFDGKKYAFDGSYNCAIVASFYDKNVKGYQYLLPAIKSIIKEGIKIKLHICGGGEYLDYYKQMSIDLGIDTNCIFYSHCEKKKVYSIMSQMDFCISSSLYESAGVSVQESILLGKPVLVTKSGGADSLVNDDSAVIVETGSVEALVNGIKEIINRKADFSENRIREFGIKNYEMSSITKKHVNIYRQVLKKNVMKGFKYENRNISSR